ncbi:MAG: hypothetical protein WA906_02200 [Pacificimonas sp.]
MPNFKSGIQWRRTMAILGAVGVLVVADQGLERIDFDFGDERSGVWEVAQDFRHHGPSLGRDSDQAARGAFTEDENRRAEADFDAFEADMDSLGEEMERLGAEMEMLAEELESDQANSAEIEAEMGRVGEEMARLAVSGAATALQDAFSE